MVRQHLSELSDSHVVEMRAVIASAGKKQPRTFRIRRLNKRIKWQYRKATVTHHRPGGWIPRKGDNRILGILDTKAFKSHTSRGSHGPSTMSKGPEINTPTLIFLSVFPH